MKISTKQVSGFFFPQKILWLLGAGFLAWIGPAAPAPAAAPDANAVNALEVAQWPAEKTEKYLIDLKPVYTGETPGELLLLAEFLQREYVAPDKGPSADIEAKRACANSLDLIGDLLYEWPSPEQFDAIRKRLASDSAEKRRPALLAASSAVSEPAAADALLAIAKRQGTPAEIEEAVLAILALGDSRNPATGKTLESFLTASATPIREAAATAIYRYRLARGEIVIPPPDAKASVITATVAGATVLDDYRRLPKAPLGSNGVQLITCNGMVNLTAEMLSAMTDVLRAGGTVLILTDAESWPDTVAAWARQNGIQLPSGMESAYGPGVPDYGHYRSFVDHPYSLRDQAGEPARKCWSQWGKDQEAPILSASRAGALVVVQEKVLGTGRVLFTTVDLPTRPIYRDNIARWLYGEALLSYVDEWAGTYSFQATGYTPHTPWAKPWAGAKPKVLYLTDNGCKRGGLEILQRLDADLRYVPYDPTFVLPATKEKREPTWMAPRAVALLAEAIPWADVLVFDTGERNMVKSLTQAIMGTYSPDSIPADLRRQIYRRVHTEGMGVVGMGTTEEFTARLGAGAPRTSELLAGAAGTVPSFDPKPLKDLGLKAASSGKGRLCEFDQKLPHLTPGQDEVLTVPPEYAVPGLFMPRFPVRPEDYWYALLTKSILWAAGQGSSSAIKTVGFKDGGAGKPATLTVTLRTADESFSGGLEYGFRDPYNQLTATNRIEIKGASAQAATSPLLAGWHVLEYRLKDGQGRVTDFGAQLVRVAAPAAITDAVPQKMFFGSNDTARLAVKLSAPFSGTVHIQAIDVFGRRVFASDVQLAEAKNAFDIDIPIRNPLCRMWDVHIDLLQDGAPISHLRRPIGIVLPPREHDFDVSDTSVPNKTLIPFGKQRMAVQVGPANFAGADAETFFRNDMDLVSGCWSGDTSIGLSTGASERTVPNERNPCLSAPAFRMAAIKDMQERGPLLRDLGVTDYMIDDEAPFGGRCYAADSLARFRTRLQLVYPSLDALNKEWGTGFKSWKDVMPCQGSDLSKPGSAVDFDVFTMWVFSEYCSFLQMLGNDYIPGFKAGQSGGVSGTIMMDMADALYGYGVNERATATKRPDAIIGSWYAPGYRFVENHETQCRHWPWWQLLRGNTRMQLWYPMEGSCGYHEDLSRPYRAFEWLAEEMRELRGGSAKLLMHSTRDEGRAAVYASERQGMVTRSIKDLQAKAAGADAKKATSLQDLYPRSHNDMQDTFLARQVEYRYISEYQVMDGVIAKRGLKLLFLPGVVSLADQERSAIREFVKGGGTLIADVDTAVRNDHGTLVGSGFAQEMFGVTFDEGTETAASGKTNQLAFVAESAPFPFTALRKAAAPGVTEHGLNLKVTDGTALASLDGQTPALIVKSHGAGKGVFLNFVVPNKSALAEALARDLIEIAGLKPVVQVAEKDKDLLSLDFGNFTDGDALYTGFVMAGKGGMVSEEQPRQVTVTFPAKRHVYDIRKGAYVGECQTYDTTLTPGIAQLYASLPYKAEAITVQAPQAGCKPGDVAHLTASMRVTGGAPGLQIWRVEVKDPDGLAQEAYARRIMVHGAQTEIALPLALNVKAGKWTCSVRDAATGVEGKAEFEVGR